MRPFQRAPTPEVLSENADAWGQAWAERLDADPGAHFHWHTVNGEPVNRIILPPLKEQTQDHCSFCDAFPPSLETIEHFRPKRAFPRDAYRWANLYFCCMRCQLKSADFDEKLLRPDEDGYSFDRYFRWDHVTGHLLVNELATPADQARAEVTIRLYHLNDHHPRFRKIEHWKRARIPDAPVDDFAYRSFIDA